MTRRESTWVAVSGMLLAGALAIPSTARGEEQPAPFHAQYRGVSTAVKADISPPLREIEPLESLPNCKAPQEEADSGLEGPVGPQDKDPVVQSWVGDGLDIPTPSTSFDGFSSLCGCSPPDPVGDVGPNHYVAMVNSHFAVYSKAGALMYGPAAINTIFAGFGGACQTENAGDPIVVYDQLADRWLLSQFTAAGPTYYNCVALSVTGDPTGAYQRYAFTTGPNFPDYPKYGVWPDAYYISTREFNGPFQGVGAYALNRAQMLAGSLTPQVISFLATPGAQAYRVGDGLLPADLDGTTLPPAGQPNFFVGTMDQGGPYGAPQDALNFWKFDVDFAVPANSTFALTNVIPTAAFDSVFPCTPGARDCIPQQGTAAKIDILSYRQRPLHRLAYRNYGTHESLVTNQAVEATANLAGTRWYELRVSSGTPSIFQQGTYAPAGVHRWMGSITMDQSGNMALGYSASSATMFPSIWYTGRLAADPAGQMPQGEAAMINGTGSQTGSQRWGDYTSMNIDPVDDCTFWYINEYLPVTSSAGWRTRIGSFKFPSCGCLSTPAAPVASASAPAPNRIDVSWNDSPSASITQYFVRRSTTPGGPYTQIAAVPDSSPGVSGGPSYTYQDLTVSGGTTYYYVVVSNDGAACTSNASNEVSALATGVCTLAPTFAGLASVTNSALATCTLQLSWSAGASNCAAGVTYSIYRGTSAGFAINAGSRIASGVAVTSYTDTAGLVSGTTYYYVVRAADSGNGNDDGNSVERSGSPSGPFTTWTDDAGDTGTAQLVPTAPWSVALTGGTAGSPRVYQTGTYTDNLCAALTTPTIVLGTNSQLTFQSKYNIETGWDKGQVEITTNGGGSWVRVPVNYPDNSTRNADACGYPANTTYFSRDIATPVFAAYTASLATWNNQTVMIRFRLSTDSSVTRTGWWIDNISITNPSSCTTATATPEPVPDGLWVPGTAMKGTRSGATVNVTWDPACGSQNYSMYRGAIGNFAAITGSSCAIGTTGTSNGLAMPDNSWWVIAGTAGSAVGSFGRDSTGAQRPLSGWAAVCPAQSAQNTTATCP